MLKTQNKYLYNMIRKPNTKYALSNFKLRFQASSKNVVPKEKQIFLFSFNK